MFFKAPEKSLEFVVDGEEVSAVLRQTPPLSHHFAPAFDRLSRDEEGFRPRARLPDELGTVVEAGGAHLRRRVKRKKAYASRFEPDAFDRDGDPVGRMCSVFA